MARSKADRGSVGWRQLMTANVCWRGPPWGGRQRMFLPVRHWLVVTAAARGFKWSHPTAIGSVVVCLPYSVIVRCETAAASSQDLDSGRPGFLSSKFKDRGVEHHRQPTQLPSPVVPSLTFAPFPSWHIPLSTTNRARRKVRIRVRAANTTATGVTSTEKTRTSGRYNTHNLGTSP